MTYPVLIIPEAVESSDGRSYEAGVLSWRESIPLMFTDETTPGHEGAFHVGNITNVRRQTFNDATWLIGDLQYDVDEEAAEAERLAVEGRIAGVSADVAEVWEETGELDELGFPVFTRVSAEIVGATQLTMPAFGDARILTETNDIPALVASLRDVEADWFTDPGLDGPTPFTVTPEGRVYGHLATWGTCHTAKPGVCVTPPKGTGYSLFHTGAVLVDGQEIPVGQITMDTGHAGTTLNVKGAQSHYDHTGACAADVRVGEDEYGIWVAGAARDGIDLDTLRAAALSGDWRGVNGNMELLAALAVNVPGFPIPRLQASAIGEEPLALVASGIVVEEEDVLPGDPGWRDEIERRMARLEALQPEPDDNLVFQPEFGKLAAVLDQHAS